MSFQEHFIETFFDLSEAIHVKPSIEDLCQFLALRICPSGELSRVYIGRLDNDGVIRTEGSFGYSIDVKVNEVETPIDTRRPMPFAMQRREVFVANREEVLSTFPGYEPLDHRSPWIAIAVVPTLGRHIFVFRLQCEIKKPEPIRLYFRSVGAILSLYDFDNRDSHTKSMKTKEVRKGLLGKPLTPRQKEVLHHIQDSKTNSYIGQELGYSESLIRHESMIIYAKLGVNGRQELLHDNHNSHRMSMRK